MFCGQGQSIIFTFSKSELLHLSCGPVQSITINSLNTFFKVKGHGVNRYKIIINYVIRIGYGPFLETNILVLLCAFRVTLS